ncbi:hypothetical protein Q8W71_31925 [Methylobacterium sp. NEAU 140]|uniref:hypothetical protein n=1 Tax=Methylobacterium sp. NEAU 140 TaxID=3064945 RepID=UPI002732FA7C|nr:hypothetical protein [Methylobacterium sp. NEAU 140]MDP4027186.1 hypothetical protein [Methylobacterium sp. NEAU 140]
MPQSRLPRRTFGETPPDVAAPHARRSRRLHDLQRHLGLALGGAPAARLAHGLVIPARPSSSLRIVRLGPTPAALPPRVIAIDEWAWRRARRYGTMIVDPEHKVIAGLLPDRDTEAVAGAQTALSDQDAAAKREREQEAQRRDREAAERSRAALVERLNRDRAEAEATLKGGIPQDLQTFLGGFVADVTAIAPDTPDARLKELAVAYAAKRTRIDEAAGLARAVTTRSRFLLDGDRGDLIVLYNDGGKAPSVVRNLSGDLVFEN